MNSIPPFTDTTTDLKATKANCFLVPECVRYLQNCLDSGYVMDAPHLVARTATRSCTTDVISAVDSFYVKTVITTFVEGTKTKYAIYIVEFASGMARGAGVSKINGLFERWRLVNDTENEFRSATDAMDDWTNPSTNQVTRRAPDLLLYQRNPKRRRGIFELEIGHRSVTFMRRDFAEYFTGKATIYFIM